MFHLQGIEPLWCSAQQGFGLGDGEALGGLHGLVSWGSSGDFSGVSGIIWHTPWGKEHTSKCAKG